MNEIMMCIGLFVSGFISGRLFGLRQLNKDLKKLVKQVNEYKEPNQ